MFCPCIPLWLQTTALRCFWPTSSRRTISMVFTCRECWARDWPTVEEFAGKHIGCSDIGSLVSLSSLPTSFIPDGTYIIILHRSFHSIMPTTWKLELMVSWMWWCLVPDNASDQVTVTRNAADGTEILSPPTRLSAFFKNLSWATGVAKSCGSFTWWWEQRTHEKLECTEKHVNKYGTYSKCYITITSMNQA